MVIFITGCVQQTKNMKDSTYYLTLQTKEIKTEISRLEKALKSEDDSLSRPTSLYYLALLYSHFKNPEPDYKHAFKNLEEYILLDPEGAEQKSSVQYLMSLLNKLIKNENLCNELKTLITTLKQENKTLTEKYEKLVIENQNTKEIIEKLKQLDIQLEKKREKKLK
jgi:predicted Zn-dependent protease